MTILTIRGQQMNNCIQYTNSIQLFKTFVKICRPQTNHYEYIRATSAAPQPPPKIQPQKKKKKSSLIPSLEQKSLYSLHLSTQKFTTPLKTIISKNIELFMVNAFSIKHMMFFLFVFIVHL